jgi:hypothetical protein
MVRVVLRIVSNGLSQYLGVGSTREVSGNTNLGSAWATCNYQQENALIPSVSFVNMSHDIYLIPNRSN